MQTSKAYILNETLTTEFEINDVKGVNKILDYAVDIKIKQTQQIKFITLGYRKFTPKIRTIGDKSKPAIPILTVGIADLIGARILL